MGEQTFPHRYRNYVKQWIKERGYKLYEVADGVGIPSRTLYEYCAGRVPFPRQSLEAVATFIGCPPAQLETDPAELPPLPSRTSETISSPLARLRETNSPPPIPSQSSLPISPSACVTIQERQETTSTQEEQDMDQGRRKLLQDAVGITGATLVTPPYALLHLEQLERIVHTLKRPTMIDTTTLDHLERITRDQWSLFASSTGSARQNVIYSVSGHFQTIVQLLNAPQPEQVQQRLGSLASDTMQIMGEILFDRKQGATADKYYALAQDVAESAQTPILQAVLLGRRSFIPLYDDDPDQALPLLNQALHLLDDTGPDTIRAWLWAVKAEVYASIGNADLCQDALDQAELFTARGTYNDIPLPFTGEAAYAGFDTSRLLGYKGVCYRRLKNPAAAQEVLKKRLALTDPSDSRTMALFFTDLATTYAQQKALEAACKHADQALSLIEKTKSARGFQRVLNLRHELEEWQDTHDIKNLDAHIMAVHPFITY